jgi:hypothetical protein
MKRAMRTMLTLWILTAGAALLVAGLYIASDRPNTQPNGFNRVYGSVEIVGGTGKDGQPVRLLGPKGDSLLLLSLQDGNVFFSDHELKTQRKVSVVHSIAAQDYATARAFVIDDRLMLIDYSTRSVKAIDLSTGRVDTNTFAGGFFDGVPYKGDSLLLRIPRPGNGEHTLALYESGEVIGPYDGVLEKIVDGKFCVDGILLTDLKDHTFAYMYFYRGQIVFMDSLMHVRRRMQTIDTVATIDIKLASPHLDGTLTWASPPPIVNDNGSYDKGVVAVESRMKADNESLEVFDRSAVLDFYQINRGYSGSVYIPLSQGERPVNFNLLSDMLYVEYKLGLTAYKINLPSASTFQSTPENIPHASHE